MTRELGHIIRQLMMGLSLLELTAAPAEPAEAAEIRILDRDWPARFYTIE